MIAGGASGIVTMADDLGGDDRLVAFMQYLRVLVVVLLTPMLIAALRRRRGRLGRAGRGRVRRRRGLAADRGASRSSPRWPRAASNVPAGTLLGPMLVAGGLTLAGVEFAVPPAVRELAFALIGLQVGLRFTLSTVKLLGRLIFPVLGAVFALLVGCAGLAVAARR